MDTADELVYLFHGPNVTKSNTARSPFEINRSSLRAILPRAYIGSNPVYTNPKTGVHVIGDDVDLVHTPTQTKMSKAWVSKHVFAEFLGSFIFIFAGTMQCASPIGGTFSQAAAFSTFFTVARSFHKSVNLSPLFSISEAIIFAEMRKGIGLVATILSVFAQFAGALTGMSLTYFFYHNHPDRLMKTLTIPKEDSVEWHHILVSEFLFTFMMSLASFYILFKKHAEFHIKNNPLNHATPASDSEKHSAVKDEEIFSFELESSAVGSLYFSGIASMGELTGGSFIITRSFAPAVFKNNFSHFEWYAIGQLVGVALALFLIETYKFVLLRTRLSGSNQ